VDIVNEGADVPLTLAFLVGHWEYVVIGGVILLLFFGRRIPDVMRSLGKGVTQFKKGLKEDGKEGEGDEKTLPAPGKDGGKAAVQDVEVEREGAADDSSKRAQ
jgi:sec-independent protein translocase protein TatA